ncbi:MAG: PucR family transcriptional regulator ligand-binding domain-containing protein [Candidatus Lutibacillus vidarii]
MSVTVGELVAMPHLGLRLHSGAGGLGRTVTWTHTSELPEPWPWVSAGDLLMTNGMSMPTEASEQVHLVEELDRVGACGLALAEQMYCPPLTPEMAAASDRLGFPVLRVAYPTPFVTISRAVGEATLVEQSRRVAGTERLYEALRAAASGKRDRAYTAPAIAKELGCPVFVCDRVSGAAYHPGDQSPPPAAREAVRRAAEGSLRVGLPSVQAATGEIVFIVPVPTCPTAVLVAVQPDGRPINTILLPHAATIVALELWHTHQALDHDRRALADLAVRVISGRSDEHRIRRELAARGLDVSHCVLAAASSPDPDRVAELHVSLWRRRVPHAVAVRASIAHVLLPGDDASLARLTDSLGRGGRVGISRPLGRVARGPDADRESAWAMGIAERTGESLVRYGVATAWSGIADLTDARAVVEQWLGPLLRDDEEHGGELVDTLRAFLDNQRSWQRSASALNVHRQTVLYRIHKVERLLGSDLSETATIAHIWLALEARDLLSGAGSAVPG